jgi:hypothetical protein
MLDSRARKLGLLVLKNLIIKNNNKKKQYQKVLNFIIMFYLCISILKDNDIETDKIIKQI